MAGDGCLKNAFAGVGCLTVLVLGGVLGWQYRAQLSGLYHSLGRREAGEAQSVDSTASSGRPSAEALEMARRKQEAMARRDGPTYVTLSAAEMAALVAQGLGPAGRLALDSLEVTLQEDRLEVRAKLDTRVLGAALGPLAGMFSAREPLSISGPARVAAVGAVAWVPDSVVIRAFPLPRGAVAMLVNRLTGRPDGVVPIPVPPTVGDLHIRPGGVTFYRGRREPR